MSARYRTIVADPPWRVHQPPSLASSKGWLKNGPNQRLPYETMTIAEIAALPVQALAADDAHLYLWTINRYVEASYGVARAWGFRPFRPSTLLTWCKPPLGLGAGGAYSLTTEHILFARRGREVRRQRHAGSWWEWTHSTKPEAFFDVVEQVSPGPFLELFARRARLDWDSWGDESQGTVEMSVVAA